MAVDIPRVRQLECCERKILLSWLELELGTEVV